MDNDKKELFDTEAAAELLGVTPGTLAAWRSNERYNLPFIRVGRLVYYERADLDRFLDSRKVHPKPALRAEYR